MQVNGSEEVGSLSTPEGPAGQQDTGAEAAASELEQDEDMHERAGLAVSVAKTGDKRQLRGEAGQEQAPVAKTRVRSTAAT